jgi:hypothetical protein
MRTKQKRQQFAFTQELLSLLFCSYGERRDSEGCAALRACRHGSVERFFCAYFSKMSDLWVTKHFE